MLRIRTMRQVPLEHDINIAINGHFWVEVANPEHPFTAMLISPTSMASGKKSRIFCGFFVSHTFHSSHALGGDDIGDMVMRAERSKCSNSNVS